MTGGAGVLYVVLVAMASLLVAMCVAILVIRGLRQLFAARRAVLVAEVRPRLLASIDHDDVAAAAAFTGRRDAVAQSISLALLPKLRGADRDALARVLRFGGVIDRAVAGLTSRSAARRERSAELLGAAGVTAAVDGLVARLDDRDGGVRMAAARALGRMGAAAAVAPVLAALGDRRLPANTASMAVLRIGPAGAPALLQALGDPNHHTRAVAAELCGSLGLTPSVERLELMVDDADAAARVSAVGALGRLGGPSTAAVLVGRLVLELARPARRGDDGLGVALATALGYIGHPSAVPVLTEALAGRHRLAFAAATSLASIGPANPAHKRRARPGSRSTSSPVSAILLGRTCHPAAGVEVGVEPSAAS